MQPQLIEHAQREPVRIYSWRDMPARKRNPRERLLAITGGMAGAVAASKRASGGGGTPLTILTGGTVAGWYRADLGATIVSGSCTALADQSTGAHNLALAATSPTVNTVDASFGGKQTLTFSTGTQQLYTPGGFALSVPVTVYLICRPDTWGAAAGLCGANAPVNTMQIAYAGGSPNIYMLNGTYANGAPCVLGSWSRIRAKFTGSGADSMRVGASAASISLGSAGSNSMTQFSIACPSGGAGMNWNEIVVCPWVTSGTEDTNMDAYFVGRFGSLLV